VSFVVRKMEPQPTTSPKFYKNAAIVFFVIGCVLVWQAFARHDWVLGAFAGITFLNALMTALKLISLRETKH
jgi:predicted acyltransferase